MRGGGGSVSAWGPRHRCCWLLPGAARPGCGPGAHGAGSRRELGSAGGMAGAGWRERAGTAAVGLALRPEGLAGCGTGSRGGPARPGPALICAGGAASVRLPPPVGWALSPSGTAVSGTRSGLPAWRAASDGGNAWFLFEGLVAHRRRARGAAGPAALS